MPAPLSWQPKILLCQPEALPVKRNPLQSGFSANTLCLGKLHSSLVTGHIPQRALLLSCPRLLSPLFSVPPSALWGPQAPLQLCQWVPLLHSELPDFLCPHLITDGLTVSEVWVINPDLRQYLINENKTEN